MFTNKYRIIFNFIIVCTALGLIACIEPSDFNVWDTSDSQVVVEAKLTDIDSVFTVIVSRSVDPTDTVFFQPINDATIIIKDDEGNSATLQPVGDGKYQTKSIKGIPGNQYLLIVEVDSLRYQSVEKMPAKPKIDSVIVKYQDYITIFDTIGYYVTFFSGKSDDTIQYYRVEIELNGVPYDDYGDLLLFEDSHIASSYQMRLPYYFKVDDTVSVRIYSLSSPVYEYFSGLAKQFTHNFSNIQPPLMDPETNIKSEPLGFFQASAVANASVIIKEETGKR